MGGNITIESEKGVGTKFFFSVKFITPTPDEVTVYLRNKNLENSEKSPRGGIKMIDKPSSFSILVVEDNIINQKLIRKILEQKGHKCIVANNGSEAVESFKNTSFDLIFMVKKNQYFYQYFPDKYSKDIEMPVMNGLDATTAIRVYESDMKRIQVPIIGLSANTRKEYVEHAMKAGMNGYITKPYMKSDIYSALEKFVTDQQ